MDVEIIAIGDEVLRGAITNTNASFISRHLAQNGFTPIRHTTLPDEHSQLEHGLKEALARSDLVITTGGLGPTCDDHTRQIAAKLFASDFHFDETIAAELRARYGANLDSLEDQATVPSKAQLLPNRVGTACGLIFSEQGKMLIMLPGVPPEMQHLLIDEVIPYLKQKFPAVLSKKYQQIYFCHLKEDLIDPSLRELHQKYPHVEAGIYPGYGILSVSLQSHDQTQLQHFQRELCRRFSSYIFSSEHGKIEEAIHAWFIQEKKTLALAESCTGGHLSALLTALAGSSDYFLGSLVAYSNELKQQILGVPEKTLKETGAVSQETAAAMLAGVFRQTTADYAIAVTGIMGPTGGSDTKPVGTVWAAIGKRDQVPHVGTLFARGNRHTRILSTSTHLLCALWRYAALGISPFPFY